MSHAPPVPPDQQSDKVIGEHSPADRKAEVAQNPAGGTANVNTREQGDPGNIAQNTHHQGHQQDR